MAVGEASIIIKKVKKVSKAKVLIHKLTKLADTDAKLRNLLMRHIERVKVAYGSRPTRSFDGPICG